MEELPDELLFPIMVDIPLDQLLLLCQTNSRFNVLSQDNLLWKNRFQKEFPNVPLVNDPDEDWKFVYLDFIRTLKIKPVYINKLPTDIQVIDNQYIKRNYLTEQIYQQVPYQNYIVIGVNYDTPTSAWIVKNGKIDFNTIVNLTWYGSANFQIFTLLDSTFVSKLLTKVNSNNDLKSKGMASLFLRNNFFLNNLLPQYLS